MRLRRQPTSTLSRADGPRRVLILSADVGEGHAAAARALAQQLERSSEPADVRVIDGLRSMGRLLHYVVEDGYRTQLRFIPWSYSIIYWMLEHVPPVRGLARAALCGFGSRGLRRRIEEHQPDVVVSTYPAVTVVLARLRRLGLIRCPTVATITDMTGLFFWAQRGIDMHLAMYDASIEDVERIAGADSVRLVRPLISAEFLEPCDRDAARAELGLPADDRIVLVSGGGWGVGDIAGAVRELSRRPDTTIVCLTGRNDSAREKLTRQFAGDDQIRVLGFTDRMADLLAAADVLVHSTGGVTCLEAMARGCPVVSYGLPVGHAKINTRAMAARDIVALANTSTELTHHVERSCATRNGATNGAAGARLDAAELVLRTPTRVRPLPSWRPRLARVATALTLAVSAGTWGMSTDEFTAVASAFMGVHPVKTLHLGSDVALVVRAPLSQVAAVAARLRADGIRASFAQPITPDAHTLGTLSRLGDAPLPEVQPVKVLNWLSVRGKLRREAGALRLGRHFMYLQPAGGITPGQLFEARAAGGRPVLGSVHLSALAPAPQRPLRAGDVVVVTCDGSAASLRGLDRLSAELSAERLGSVPVSAASA